MTAPSPQCQPIQTPLWQEIAGGEICLLAIGGYLASDPSWLLVGVLAFCAVLS